MNRLGRCNVCGIFLWIALTIKSTCVVAQVTSSSSLPGPRVVDATTNFWVAAQETNADIVLFLSMSRIRSMAETNSTAWYFCSSKMPGYVFGGRAGKVSIYCGGAKSVTTHDWPQWVSCRSSVEHPQVDITFAVSDVTTESFTVPFCVDTTGSTAGIVYSCVWRAVTNAPK